MEKRDVTKLTVYETNEEIKELSLEVLKPLYISNTSEIVYIAKNKRIYGIICLGDVLRYRHGQIKINTDFFRLTDWDMIRAREIFREKSNIHKIPVINEEGELLGDYSRWDDSLFLKRNAVWFAEKAFVAKILSFYKTVYLVEPYDNMNSSYLYFKECLDQFKIYYTVINKEECGKEYSEDIVFIFLNEEERRGTQCLLRVELGRDEKPINSKEYGRWITLKILLLNILKARELKVVEEWGGGRNIKESVLPL